MTVELFVVLFAGSLAAGALGSALGMAGGIFVVPLLTLIAHVPFPTAVAVSLISVIACSCASAPGFLAAGLPNLRLALVLEVFTALGALVGVLMIGLVPSSMLYGIFAAVLLVSAVQMIAGRREPAAAAGAPRYPRLDGVYADREGQLVPYRVVRLPLGMTFMFGAGTLSALLGIGSGVLKIPAMDAAMRLPIKVSSATANLMIGVTACGAAAAYLLAGTLDLRLAAPVVLGSLAGSVLGAQVLIRLAGPSLRIVFMVVLFALAIPMTANAFGLGWGGVA
ncbi:sulfite exporter TauE/SafE family protein [Microbacterium sp. ISL-59]|uniref:sulfite exporter TauE/SafE family protein n=1 Tax=Microbacterium sp. ISL-59 TaxID=2819159 RepID=UPI001BEC045B|nr:sulfite exporter TauE/SafE family protein [Microbacterium sp. ISL-59]MBT2496673.1 sulfite exporter TauE/SafE family protein [Microbacterium sp. ISL-59]